VTLGNAFAGEQVGGSRHAKYPAKKGKERIANSSGYLAKPASETTGAQVWSARMMVEARVTVKRVLLRRTRQKIEANLGG
jgi:hypothetical protein